MLIIGDVHGCYKTLMALLAKCPDDDVCFTGDLIDRGPASRAVISLVRLRNYRSVMGNHEDLMIECLEKNKTIWTHPNNGGDATLKNYGFEAPFKPNAPSATAPQGLKNHPDFLWIKSLPLYLEFPELRDQNGRYLVVSHSSVQKYWHKKNDPSEIYRDTFRESVLWGRPKVVDDEPEIFNVFGHTPVYSPLVKEHYANIDTGCFYKNQARGMGCLTALQFPEMQIFSQKNID